MMAAMVAMVAAMVAALAAAMVRVMVRVRVRVRVRVTLVAHPCYLPLVRVRVTSHHITQVISRALFPLTQARRHGRDGAEASHHESMFERTRLPGGARSSQVKGGITGGEGESHITSHHVRWRRGW